MLALFGLGQAEIEDGQTPRESFATFIVSLLAYLIASVWANNRVVSAFQEIKGDPSDVPTIRRVRAHEAWMDDVTRIAAFVVMMGVYGCVAAVLVSQKDVVTWLPDSTMIVIAVFLGLRRYVVLAHGLSH